MGETDRRQLAATSRVVNVKSGNRTASASVVYPEVKKKATLGRRHPRDLRDERLGADARGRSRGSELHRDRARPRIKAPVHGFYAGNDARIGATVPKTQEQMKAAGKSFDIVTYDGADHGFMRAGDAPAPAADVDQKSRDAYAANKKARDQAWVRWKVLLAKL